MEERYITKMAKNALSVKISGKTVTFTQNSQSFFMFFQSETVISALIGYFDQFYILSATWVGYWHSKPILERIIPGKLKMCKMNNV